VAVFRHRRGFGLKCPIWPLNDLQVVQGLLFLDWTLEIDPAMVFRVLRCFLLRPLGLPPQPSQRLTGPCAFVLYAPGSRIATEAWGEVHSVSLDAGEKQILMI